MKEHVLVSALPMMVHVKNENKMTANVNAVMRPQVGNVNKIVPLHYALQGVNISASKQRHGNNFSTSPKG